MDKRKLVILTGPTGVGKTKLSIKLAKAINGEIVSADSVQVYKHMDIGSAKIKPCEMDSVIHHMIDIIEPTEAFNVASFKEKVLECFDKIYERGHVPILVGGTGFYIQAVLNDIDFSKEENSPVREKLEEEAKKYGNKYMHEKLALVDEESAKLIHENNVKRVIRALEFYEINHTKISDHNQSEREKQSAFNSLYFVLTDDRDRLYSRIEDRIDEMIDEGLVDEVKSLLEMGCQKGSTSMQALGYKEIIEYIEGNCSLQEAIEKLKTNTRHFAKRQLTWFNRERDIIWLNKGEFGMDEDKILEFMLDRINKAFM